MRTRFDQQLHMLNQEMTRMGSQCEYAIDLALSALIDGKFENAERVIAMDNEIDAMERSIESLCLKLLLQQQPVARDLRQISAALKMITDMERIGDQCADIAEITLSLQPGRGKECTPIQAMAEAAKKMVTDSIDAYVRKDVELAKTVIANDDVVDEYFNASRSFLIQTISNHEEDGEFAVDLLMIAKYFERIGDHATNIAEWVEYSVTGVHQGEQP